MGRRSYGLPEYRRLAEKKELIFLDGVTPTYTTDSVRWKCKRCGRIILKSYANTKRNPPCICYSKTLSENDYLNLAEQLGLKWVGETLPKTNKDETMWFSHKTSTNFKAAYYDMAYSVIRPDLRKYVING